MPRVSQGTLEFACHLWYAFYFVLCADADGNVSLLRSDKLPEAVGTGAAQVPITVGLGALLVTR